MSAIRLVCEVPDGKDYRELTRSNTIKVNGIAYDSYRSDGQQLGDERVAKFKVTGLEKQHTYRFRTRVKDQSGSWGNCSVDFVWRQQRSSKKRGRQAEVDLMPGKKLSSIIVNAINESDDDQGWSGNVSLFLKHILCYLHFKDKIRCTAFTNEGSMSDAKMELENKVGRNLADLFKPA